MPSFTYHSPLLCLLLSFLQHLTQPSHGFNFFPFQKRGIEWSNDDGGPYVRPQSGEVSYIGADTDPSVAWLDISADNKQYVWFLVVYPFNTLSVFWASLSTETLDEMFWRPNDAKRRYDRAMSRRLPDLRSVYDKYGHEGRKPTAAIVAPTVLTDKGSPNMRKLVQWFKDDVQRILGGRNDVESWELLGASSIPTDDDDSESDFDSDYEDCTFSDDESDDAPEMSEDDGPENLGPIAFSESTNYLFFRRADAAGNRWEWTLYSNLVDKGKSPATRLKSFDFNDNT